MSKKNLLLLVFCLFINHLQAQQITWGNIDKFGKSSFDPANALGQFRGNYFLLLKKFDVHYLQMYSNSTLKLEKEVELVEKLGKEDLEYQFSHMIGDNIHIFYAIFDKKAKETKHYVITYKTNLEAVGTLREVVTTQTVMRRWGYDLYISISNDSSKIALTASHDVEDGEKQKFTILLYDNKMKKISTKNVETSYVGSLYSLHRTCVDNEGNVYTFGKLYKEKIQGKRSTKDFSNYTFEAAVFGQDGSKLQKTITLKEDLKDIKVIIDKKNILRVIGLYGAKSQGDAGNGVFSMTFDKDLNMSKKSQKTFSTDIIKSINKENKDISSVLDQFDIKEVINNNDGTVVMLVERSHAAALNSMTSTTNITNKYYDQDILWIKLTDTFEVGQIKQIAKNQVNWSVLPHSFVSYHKGDGVIHLLFNDNIENTETNSNEAKIMKVDTDNAALFSVKIDNDGNMVKKLLYKKHPESFILLPRFSSQINDKEILLFSIRGLKYMLGKATF